MNRSSTIATLNDVEILSFCKEGILIENNFNPGCIKQACYELRCSNIYYDLSDNNKRYVLNNNDYVLIKPKQMVVAITLESLRLPADVLGRILTKGMLFSLGLLPVNTYADPGFEGQLGIVLFNASNNYLKLIPGDPIAKIEFSKLQNSVMRPYSGQHGYQTSIWPIRSDMILNPDEIKKDRRIRTFYEEITSSYGEVFTHIIKRLYGVERRLLLFSCIYFIIMLLLIGIMSETAWLTPMIAVIIGVGVNIIATLLIHFATSFMRK